MLGLIVRRAFWIGYDRLGRLVLLNIIWFLFAFAPVLPLMKRVAHLPLLPALVFFSLYLVYLGLLCAGVFHSLMFMDEEDVNFLRLFSRGIYRSWRAGLPLLVLNVVILILLVHGAVFYLQRMPGWPGRLLAGVVLWMTIFWLAAQQYFLPVASMGGDRLGRALKRSFSLALDNFFLSLALMIFALSYVFLCALPWGVGLMIFGASGLAAIYRAAGELLFLEYDLSFHPLISLEEMRRSERENQKRGLRNFFRPWE